MPLINTASFTDAIGFSVYSFEGIGIILPVMDITSDPKNYYKIVITVILSVIGIYIVFG